jgi:hypothetical protein
MKTEHTTVRNWGNYPEAFARVHTPANTDELSSLFQTPGPLLARGNGRCYGDAALADVLVSTLQLNRILDFDAREGRIRCLGQAGPERWAAAAEVPTFREQGLDVLGGSARGIAGPPGIPAPIRDALREAFRGALADPAFVAEAARLNLPLRPLIGDDYAAMMAADLANLRALWQRRPWKE